MIFGEIFVKTQLTYQGGDVFRKGINFPDQYATTILAFIFLSLFDGKKISIKVLPVYRLDASFQYNQTVNLLKIIQQNGVCIKVILCDNNKVNQKLF